MCIVCESWTHNFCHCNHYISQGKRCIGGASIHSTAWGQKAIYRLNINQTGDINAFCLKKKPLVIFVDFPYAALCCWALNRLIMVTLLLAVWAVLAVELLLLDRKWSGRQMWFPLISYGDPLKMTDLICTEADWNSLIWLMSDNWISISRSVPLMPLLLRHDTAQEVHQDKPICLEARCFVCFSSGRQQRGCKIAVLEVYKYCTIAVDEVIIVNSWSDIQSSMAIRMSAESLGSV